MEGLLARELGGLVLVPGLLPPALGLSSHCLSDGYDDVISLEVRQCTKVPATVPKGVWYRLCPPSLSGILCPAPHPFPL